MSEFLNHKQENEAVKSEVLLDKTISKPAKGKMSSIRRVVRLTMAAAAILILIAVAIVGYKLYKLSPETLYNEVYIEYDLSTARRGESITDRQIEEMYQQKDFAAIIKQAKKKVELNDKDYLLTGLSHLQLNDPFSAIYFFKKLTGNKLSLYQQDAEYYLVMGYLKNLDYDHAITLMQKIKNHSGHIYRDRFTSNFIGKVKMLKWR